MAMAQRRSAVEIGAYGVRRFSRRVTVGIVSIGLLLAWPASLASAASGTWNSTATTGAWETTGNWVSGVVPGATSGTTNTDTATFNSSSSTLLVTPDAGRNLEFITFDTSAAAYTIGATAGNALLLTAGGQIQIAGTFTGTNLTETVNAPLVLEGDYTLADNSTVTGDLLSFGGTITPAAAGVHTLTIAGADNTTIGGAIGGGANIAIVKGGIGTLTLGGNNTFTGGMTINAGNVLLTNAGALNSATPNAVAFGAASTGTLTLNGLSTSLNGLTTNASVGSPVVQNASSASAVLTIGNPSSNTYAGVLQNGTGAGTLALVKSGAGGLTLSGLNTYSGGTTVAGGTLISATTGSLGTGPVTLNAGALRVSAASSSAAVSGFGGSGTGWTVNSSGITSTAIANNVLTLTDGANNESRSAFFNTPQPYAIGASGFTASFTYTPGGSLGADGTTFILHNDSRGTTALGSGGGLLGVSGITPSAEWEINIYSGHTIGTNFATNGAYNGIYNTTGAVSINSGDPVNVTLTYNPVQHTISEMLADPTANTTFSTSYSNIDLSSILGATSTAYIGFTGATGGLNSTQTISNFSYSVVASTPGVYGNAVVVPGNTTATIDVGPTAANPTVSMGPLSVMAGSSSTLNITASTAATNQPYTLSLGNTTLSSNLVVNVANNTNGGGNAAGTLSLGSVSDGGGGLGITVNGPGSVVLRSANSYAGPTTINGGTLKLADGSTSNIGHSPSISIGFAGNLDVTGLAGGTLLVGAGATPQSLQGSGVLTGNLTVSNGSALVAASGATLTIAGGLNLQNGSISHFNLAGKPNDSENPTTALVNIASSLSVTGTNTVNLSGTAQLGTYDLYAFAGAGPSASQFAIGTLPTGHFDYLLSTGLANELDLIVSNATGSAAWNFNGNGKYSDVAKWDLNQIPNGAGLTATFGNGGSNAVTLPGVTVTVDDANVVGTLTFNNTNGTNYTLGNDGVAGHGLTLNNNGGGANVNVSAGNHSIFSNLTLADTAKFNIAPNCSLLLSVGTIGESGGSRSLTKTGAGTLTIDVASNYTGTTTVAAGTLQTTPTGTISAGPLIVNTAGGVNSTVNLNNNQTVSSLSGIAVGGGTARVSVAGGTTLTVAQSGNSTFAGSVVLSGSAAMLAKSGPGILEVDGPPTFSAGSLLTISGGLLRFNITSGSAVIGAGVTATVSNNATLELAGTTTALANGVNRVDVANNGNLNIGNTVVTPTTVQQVGAIDGTGATGVEASASLTANHIVQGTLAIGGTDATNFGLATIDASDASGNPLSSSGGGLALAGSLAPSDSFGSGAGGSSSLASDAGGSSGGASSLGGTSAGSGSAAVPEPSSLMLVALATLAGVGLRFARRRRLVR
jgi:autotransporter-associated beta strand protein